MRARALAIGVVVVALVGCGSKPLTNERLASDLTTQVGIKTSVVCWKQAGKLGTLSAMGYDHICGINRSKPAIYIRTGVKAKPGWCLVTPRFNKGPDCPLG